MATHQEYTAWEQNQRPEGYVLFGIELWPNGEHSSVRIWYEDAESRRNTPPTPPPTLPAVIVSNDTPLNHLAGGPFGHTAQGKCCHDYAPVTG